MANPENPEKRRGFLNPRFLNSKTGRIIGIGTITIGSTIAALPFFDYGLTRAEVKAHLQSLPKKEAAERLQYVDQSVIEFTIGNDHYMWDATNASYNINPPNELVIPTATVRIAINGTWLYAKRFQPLQSLYPTPLMNLTMGGMAVDVSLDRYYLGTTPFINNNPENGQSMFAPYLEIGTDVRMPENYTGRLVIRKGFPAAIYGNSSQYLTLGKDSQGLWLNMMFDNCVDPLEIGTYQIRRDHLGNLIGDTASKLSNSIVPGMPYQNFLPITLR